MHEETASRFSSFSSPSSMMESPPPKRELALHSGVHVCVYISNFRRAYERLAAQKVGGGLEPARRKAHGAIGITVALIPVVQAMLGILREPAVGGSNPEGGDKASERRGTPKRSIHKVLGWSIVICGLLNCVFGAELLRRKLGDDPAPAVSSAVAFLVLVCVALIAKLLLWGKSLDEKDRVHAYVGNA